jgi:hypothetical protein
MQQMIIRYDHADLLSIGLMLVIPVLASWGTGFGIIGLMQKGRKRVFSIIGTSINGSILVIVLVLWIKFIHFFSHFNGWID